MRQKHRSYYGNTPNQRSLLGSVVRVVLYLVILGGAGGVTWVALMPMDPDVQQVVREIPNDRLGEGPSVPPASPASPVPDAG